MKHIIVAFALFLIVGCTPSPPNSSAVPIKATYLVQGDGQLSQEDLQAHPEVITTNALDDFKELARSKGALWIDINAVELVDMGWLGEAPQKYYPIVLVGNGDEACSFFETLPYFTFEVPCCLDCSSPPQGFSVNLLTSESGGPMRGTMHGYKEPPTVQRILDITNPLLESTK